MNIIDLYKRNKDYLIISILIFLGSFSLGYLLAGFLDILLAPLMREFKKSVIEEGITIISIFSHNLQAILLLYLGGLSLSIFTGLFLALNGLFMGYFATKVPLVDFILLVAPHGMFEIPGIIIAGVAGFRLSSFIIHFIGDLIRGPGSFTQKLKKSYDNNIREFKDSLLLFLTAVILILIAAIIEAEFTLTFYYMIKGF
ncbi:MAG: stage II sporulation protein M [Methanobacteriaceae archaeon]|nr:stage II sporulation protein M [Methanobacteriaceae archaeon]